jgi:hypothetical protein
MLISDELRLIVLAPWKCASSTLHYTLEKYNTQGDYDRFFYFNPYLQRVVHQHITLADLFNLPESRLGYFTATFVRNPYDRAYSGFMQIQRDFAEQPKHLFTSAWIGDLVRTQIADNMHLIVRSGFDFDNWIQLVPEYEVREVGRNTNMPLHPAHYWTHLNGRRRVDFVGKVEKFSDDFKKFINVIKIEEPELISSNISFEDNMTDGYRYTNRMNRRSLDRINYLFEEDFRLLDYEMI